MKRLATILALVATSNLCWLLLALDLDLSWWTFLIGMYPITFLTVRFVHHTADGGDERGGSDA